ncbi:hypothetical protein HPB51_010873 [Rhipicephalus microplus]|uniref:GT23 domain-containing protein n=1 Tax=Rhipicephalus microplus TaxID=6941 RepID=A0A9J6DMA4_RHIMP|nr:hypothetical protein HPB51_010873 [Rhipicephalus microplus]
MAPPHLITMHALLLDGAAAMWRVAHVALQPTARNGWRGLCAAPALLAFNPEAAAANQSAVGDDEAVSPAAPCRANKQQARAGEQRQFGHDGRLIGFRSTTALYNHVQLSVQELQRFLAHQLRAVAVKVPQSLQHRVAALSIASKERLHHLAAEMKTMAHLTGILKRKRQALFQLKNKVRRAIDRNQNEGNCSQALVCRLANPYGFSSAIHDVLWCLAQGMSQGRPVLVDSEPWHYAPSSWHHAFLPLSFACPARTEPRSQWPGENLSSTPQLPLMLMQIMWGSFYTHKHYPSTPPTEAHITPTYDNVKRQHILQETTQERVLRTSSPNGIPSPNLLLHVRRTDKESEASFHDAEEYMEHAEAFFAAAGPRVPRRVFVATDEPDVFHELRQRRVQIVFHYYISRFLNYSFIGDEAASGAARNHRTRYSLQSLLLLARDLVLLSECDLVVCTLSSGVCRVVYELMQARRTDASAHLVSLDVDYFYAFVQFPARRAIYRSVASVRLIDLTAVEQHKEHSDTKQWCRPQNSFRAGSTKLQGNQY